MAKKSYPSREERMKDLAAVLPADRELQAEIMADSRRRCRECRRPFVPKAKNTLYCPECAARRTRRSKREWAARNKGRP